MQIKLESVENYFDSMIDGIVRPNLYVESNATEAMQQKQCNSNLSVKTDQ